MSAWLLSRCMEAEACLLLAAAAGWRWRCSCGINFFGPFSTLPVSAPVPAAGAEGGSSLDLEDLPMPGLFQIWVSAAWRFNQVWFDCWWLVAEGWLLVWWLLGGWTCAFLRRLPANCAGPWPEKYGVRPRPMFFLREALLRLVSKLLCDGTSSGIGVLVVLFLLWSWPGRRWRWKTGEDGGKHRRPCGPICNFSFL